VQVSEEDEIEEEEEECDDDTEDCQSDDIRVVEVEKK
jgi:hypothetical protein